MDTQSERKTRVYRKKKTNVISFKRVPGSGTAICTATISLQFDAGDPEAVKRFVLMMRDLIPEDEREQFLEDWKSAAAAAGFRA